MGRTDGRYHSAYADPLSAFLAPGTATLQTATTPNRLFQKEETLHAFASRITKSKSTLLDRVKVVATIDDAKTFMKEFKKVDHNYPLGTPPFGLSSGTAILLTYSDGTKELIAREGCALIDTEKETTDIEYHGWFAMEDYTEFVEKWLQGT